MRRNAPLEYTIGKAEFSSELRAIKTEDRGPATLTVYRMDEDGGRIETAEAKTFKILGAGVEEATFFTCVDPFAPEGFPYYAAGEVAFGTLLPGTNRCDSHEKAGMEAIKFVLRIPQEERAAALARMRAFGAHWRAKAKPSSGKRTSRRSKADEG